MSLLTLAAGAAVAGLAARLAVIRHRIRVQRRSEQDAYLAGIHHGIILHDRNPHGRPPRCPTSVPAFNPWAGRVSRCLDAAECRIAWHAAGLRDGWMSAELLDLELLPTIEPVRVVA